MTFVNGLSVFVFFAIVGYHYITVGGLRRLVDEVVDRRSIEERPIRWTNRPPSFLSVFLGFLRFSQWLILTCVVIASFHTNHTNR